MTSDNIRIFESKESVDSNTLELKCESELYLNTLYSASNRLGSIEISSFWKHDFMNSM